MCSIKKNIKGRNPSLTREELLELQKNVGRLRIHNTPYCVGNDSNFRSVNVHSIYCF